MDREARGQGGPCIVGMGHQWVDTPLPVHVCVSAGSQLLSVMNLQHVSHTVRTLSVKSPDVKDLPLVFFLHVPVACRAYHSLATFRGVDEGRIQCVFMCTFA